MPLSHQDLIGIWQSPDGTIVVELRRLGDRYLVRTLRAEQTSGWVTYDKEPKARDEFEEAVKRIVESGDEQPKS